MQKADFIATPFYICRGINATNKDRAINSIKKCQRCKSTNTHADTLLAPAGHCYQIIFECFTCGLRLDIFERDLYSVEDYCSETVAEPLQASTSSHGDVDLRNLPAQMPPVISANGTRKVLLNLPASKISASNITAFNNDDDTETVDEQAAKNVVPDANELASLCLNTRMDIEFGHAWLAAQKVKQQFELEQRIRAEFQARENRRRAFEQKRLEAQRAKFGQLKAEREDRLHIFVDRVRQWASGRVCNWPKIYEICKNPTHPYGINMDMLCDFYEAFLVWQSEGSTPFPGKVDPVARELASYWQFGERLAITAEFRVYFEEICKEDHRKRQLAMAPPPQPIKIIPPVPPPPQRISPFLQIPLPAASMQQIPQVPRFSQRW
ncbi:unnamed protein product, partial [Mesorhabditis belari]|uniref:Uncharacterized protein n=1 Tax=Mesorhabditis belari TaxID=2138241 RepID=A0AAF3FHC6_9BILA